MLLQKRHLNVSKVLCFRRLSSSEGSDLPFFFVYVFDSGIKVLRDSRYIKFVFPKVFRKNYSSEGCVPDLLCFLCRE